MASDDPRIFAEFVSASGMPVAISQQCDQFILDVGGHSAVLTLGQQDEFMQAVMAAWMAAEAWAASPRAVLEVVSDG